MRAVWQRLRAADLPREEYALAVRLLHGSLYVGAFLCHIHVLPPGAACCPHASCSVGAARPPLDDLGHAFLACPAVAPAVDWVCRVFAAASGGPQPPACPRVFLGDEASVWAPDPVLRFLWTRLRLACLHAVWQLRARRSLTDQPFDATAVCGTIVAALRAAICRDWTRATHDMRRMDGVYAEWFRGRGASLTMDCFQQRWTSGGALCVADVAGGLQLRFSMAHPVPAPAAGRQPAAGPAAAAGARPARHPPAGPPPVGSPVRVPVPPAARDGIG